MAKAQKAERPAEQETPAPAGELEELMTSLPGEGWVVAIYEVIPGKGEQYIERLAPSANFEEVVGARHGAGEYVWRLRTPEGRWASREKDQVVRTMGRFSISEKSFPKVAAAVRVTAPAEASSWGMEKLYLMMLEQQRAASAQQMQMFTAMMDSNTKLLAAMIQRPQADPVDAVAKLHQLSGGGQGGGGVGEVLELAEKLADRFGGGRRGSKEADPSALDKVKDIAEIAAPVLQETLALFRPAPRVVAHPAAARPAPPAGQPPAQLPPPRVVESATGEVVAEGDAVMGFLEKIRLAQYLKSLVKFAERDSDPTAYGVVTLDQLESMGLQRDVIAQAMGAPELLDTLCKHIPEIVPHREWFGELIEEINRQLKPEGAGEGAADESEKLEPPGGVPA